jgi:hypothetical protein
MSYSVGDGMAVLGIAAGIVGYFHVKQQARTRQLQIIHEERMAAMEKGIPLPEFPLEAAPDARIPDPNVLPILGMVLFSLSVGAMIVLYLILPAASGGFWVTPLPLTFLGIGFLAFHLLKRDAGR